MDRNRFSLVRIFSLLAFFCGSWMFGTEGQAQSLRFVVEMYGNANGPTIKVTNYSNEQINKFELSIGNTAYHFDGASISSHPPGGSATVVAPTDRGDNIVINLSGFDPGESFIIRTDVDDDPANNTVENYRLVMFNNSTANSVAKATGASGTVQQFSLPDAPAGDSSFVFTYNGGELRQLAVRSVAESDSSLFVNRVQVDIVGTGVVVTNIGPERVITLFKGETVEITAPQRVFKNIFGMDITDSAVNDPAQIKDDAEERFTAIGISVNDEPQTGDPTLYRFDLINDTVVVVKWRHDYALTIKQDFTQTESQDRDATGNPWAGPMTSEAEGNPNPLAQKHWIRKGETVVAQVDGQVLDFSRPGLDVRYVPKGFTSFGPPNFDTTKGTDGTDLRNGVDIRQGLSRSIQSLFDPGGGHTAIVSPDHGLTNNSRIVITGTGRYDGDWMVDDVTDDDTFWIVATYQSDATLGTWKTPAAIQEDFSVGQSPPQKQQVQQFSMYGPGGITYVWQIQFGVKVNIDDIARTSLPKLFVQGEGESDFSEVENGEGTFWFDPGTKIRIASPANVAGPNSMALGAWISGDGWYFSSSADIDSSDGSLVNGGPATVGGSPVATWMPNFLDSAGVRYRGLEIPGLQRSARVLWRYGGQQIRVNATLGEYVFQHDSTYSSLFTDQPVQIEQLSVSGSNTSVGANDMAIWDENASRLFPLVPGIFKAHWQPPGSTDVADVIVTVNYPLTAHYPHVTDAPPVALDPDPNDNLTFQEIRYTENQAVVDGDKYFRASLPGKTVLLFKEIQRIGRGEPREFVKVKVVESRTWRDALTGERPATIGRKITDSQLDGAKLETGYVLFDRARFNPFIYDISKLEGLAANDVYDMDALRSSSQQKSVINKDNLPGPIIPVNLHPAAAETNRIVVVWYDDPAHNDELLWPHAARIYKPEWPTSAADGLGRIVIASQFGSESLNNDGSEQIVVGAVNGDPAETTYNPSRLQQVQIYAQPDPGFGGYNPNEEHALIAPSLRFADVSPRPPAVYALRVGDLNTFSAGSIRESGQPANYTSHPRVLTQFFDTADDEFKMRVYQVNKEDSVLNYGFASTNLIVPNGNNGVTTLPTQLVNEPHVLMKAGEPVIPFYPLGVVIGASPSPETFGTNIRRQSTYWEDHKGTSWAVSGGTNAWFTMSTYYPMAPDFYWPSNRAGFIQRVSDGVSATGYMGVFPQAGDSVAFLPDDIQPLLSIADGSSVQSGLSSIKPRPILYKSDWQDLLPIIKAGETVTYQGGENRADNPFTQIIGIDGDVQNTETPGLPQVVAFASAEVVFDSLNTLATASGWTNQWTARVAQVLDHRTATLTTGNFPPELTPATKRTRVSQGKYIFNELPASLQKRFRYDPLSAKIEIFGLLNDKDIGDSTLTAAPPAVYVLEPNIMTTEDRDALKSLDSGSNSEWDKAIQRLYLASRDPDGLITPDGYMVGLERGIVRDPITGLPLTDYSSGFPVVSRTSDPAPVRAFGPGLALLPNAEFLNPSGGLPEVSYVVVAENNDPTLGGSPITLHLFKVDRRLRYRGAIKTISSDNVFDENLTLRHQGDFGANASSLVFDWWYRPDDGSLNVPPPGLLKPGEPNPWKLFPDPSGDRGGGRYEILLKGNPNAPETLLADTFWFCRYRHQNDVVQGTDWGKPASSKEPGSIFEWAGAGNSDPNHDFDADGLPDYRAQLASGWIKRVLDAVNPYEARIRDFEGDSPDTRSSMISEFGPRFEGAVALNPDKNVIENVGLIELYETILKRGSALSIDLSRPVSTPAIANALQLASTRISDFYTILGNEAYADAVDPTIGIGSDSIEYGRLAPAVFPFQNQLNSQLAEELALLRGVDDYFARPVYNRLFWNFTKGEGEAAYAINYDVSDINKDGFIDEADAMILFPQGHGDAWGHYLTAVRNQYELLRHPYFNWVSRSEFYNLQDIVIKVDFLDERKFAQVAAAKAKVGAEIVDLTYREKFVENPQAQWQGYTDGNKDRSWGVEEWGRRTGQGAYFDWVTANALLPSEHPNGNLEGIQKVDRQSNSDISVVSANLTAIQNTLDESNKGFNPLGVARGALAFDIDPNFLEVGSGIQGELHFDQIYKRAVGALENATAIWDNANEDRNRIRQIANSEAEFRNDVFQEDLTYKNELIRIFGKPYEGNIGPGRIYPAGYDGPDVLLYMYVDVRQINDNTVPGPSTGFASFDGNELNGGDIYNAFNLEGDDKDFFMQGSLSSTFNVRLMSDDVQRLFAPTFTDIKDEDDAPVELRDQLYSVAYTDLSNPKIPLDNLAGLMPVTAAGYTFQAPSNWGKRAAVGELQLLINQMIQKEAEIASAIGAWDGLQGGIVREIRLVNARLDTAHDIRVSNEVLNRLKVYITSVLKGIQGIRDITAATKESVTTFLSGAVESLPKNLPTGGLSVSPGDALAPARGGLEFAGVAVTGGINAIDATLKTLALVAEISFDIAEAENALWEGRENDRLAAKEMLANLENLVGDEPVLRIAVFKEIQGLRELSDQYRTLVDEGSRAVDERAAYNKRVAAQTQRNRYQDMTFRVSRNHYVQNYRSAFDLASRYVYLAAKAYDYETNFDPLDAGSASPIFNEIVKARGLGLFDGEPRQGKGGLSGALAKLKTNYEVLRGQLGINNPGLETGKLSLRTENFRILPKGATQPGNEFPAPGTDSDSLWLQTLNEARVSDLWKIPEFRYFCRPFAAEADSFGNHIAEPGLVLEFSTQIKAGENFFGQPLSGGDHAYDPSQYSTRVHDIGLWFSDYLSEDVLNDLPAAPRAYLIPVGTDIISVPTSQDPNMVRLWNVVDQRIPVPIAATTADLDQASFIPLIDTLNGRLGDPRKFSMLRAHHDGGDAVNSDELVPNTRLVGRSVWNTRWLLIIPGRLLNEDPDVGLNRFINQVSDIKMVFQTYSYSGN